MIRLASFPQPPRTGLAGTAAVVLGARHLTRDADAGSFALRSAAPAAAERPLDIAIADWDDLFHAVGARLRAAAEMPPAQALASQAPGAARQVQAVVLECVAALEQLHAALTLERQQRHETGGASAGGAPADAARTHPHFTA